MQFAKQNCIHDESMGNKLLKKFLTPDFVFAVLPVCFCVYINLRFPRCVAKTTNDLFHATLNFPLNLHQNAKMLVFKLVNII